MGMKMRMRMGVNSVNIRYRGGAERGWTRTGFSGADGMEGGDCGDAEMRRCGDGELETCTSTDKLETPRGELRNCTHDYIPTVYHINATRLIILYPQTLG